MQSGDVVQLKSGGPKMTIVHLCDDGRVKVCYFKDGFGYTQDYFYPRNAPVVGG
jgi:uncharacterized protein YodC (DUF2158 family)